MPNVWDNELQGIKQMGFTSTADLENLETSGKFYNLSWDFFCVCTRVHVPEH